MSAVSQEQESRPLWLTWEVTRRSRSLSAALAAELHEITAKGGRIRRYAASAVRTLRLLRSASSSVIFVQSPSIVLANLVTMLRSTAHRAVIIDAHNGGIDPLDGRSRILSYLAHRALRRSDLVIVTNEALAERVRSLGATPFVLTDPIPALNVQQTERVAANCDLKRVVAICTWAGDEPVAELVNAAPLLPPNYRLSITGRPKLKAHGITQVPANVELTGFLPEESYEALISSADVLVDLTTRENCLVCGAYEALSIHKPLVVSDTAALRALLGDAALYCSNRDQSIARAIAAAGTSAAELEARARRRKEYIIHSWEDSRAALGRELDKLIGRRHS